MKNDNMLKFSPVTSVSFAWLERREFKWLPYWSYSLSASLCCSCWSTVSTLVPRWSTLAFIGDATASPAGNSSVPMKLLRSRKLREGKEENDAVDDAFLR